MHNVGDHVVGVVGVGAFAEDREDGDLADGEVGGDQGGVDGFDGRVSGEVVELVGGDDEEGIVGLDGVGDVGVGEGPEGGIHGVAGAGQRDEEGLVFDQGGGHGGDVARRGYHLAAHLEEVAHGGQVQEVGGGGTVEGVGGAGAGARAREARVVRLTWRLSVGRREQEEEEEEDEHEKEEVMQFEGCHCVCVGGWFCFGVLSLYSNHRLLLFLLLNSYVVLCRKVCLKSGQDG